LTLRYRTSAGRADGDAPGEQRERGLDHRGAPVEPAKTLKVRLRRRHGAEAVLIAKPGCVEKHAVPVVFAFGCTRAEEKQA
jgi:hypothetical protein